MTMEEFALAAAGKRIVWNEWGNMEAFVVFVRFMDGDMFRGISQGIEGNYSMGDGLGKGPGCWSIIEDEVEHDFNAGLNG